MIAIYNITKKEGTYGIKKNNKYTQRKKTFQVTESNTLIFIP